MSKYRVAACGFAPAALPPHPAYSDVALLPAPSDDGFLAAALAFVDSAADQTPVLLVHSGRNGHAGSVRTVAALSRRNQVLPVALHRPPTGLAAAATWLATLAIRRVRPGMAVAMLDWLPGLLPTYAAVTSVSGLERPTVSLAQHAASWLPFTTFGLALGREERLYSGRVETFEEPFGDCDAVCAGDSKLANNLKGLPVSGGVVEMAQTPLSGQWWGRAGHYEVTLVPRSPIDAIAAMRMAPLEPCPQCGDFVLRSCPSCNTPVAGASEGVA